MCESAKELVRLTVDSTYFEQIKSAKGEEDGY